jgi:signal transduction histidine kinase
MLLLASHVFAEDRGVSVKSSANSCDSLRVDHARDLEAVRALLSHDFGAPIATLRGLLNLLKDDVDNGFIDELPELIDSALLMMNDVDGLCDKVLAIARSDDDVESSVTSAPERRAA